MKTLCECSCGHPAPIAPRNIRRHGHVKGKPQRFIHNHHLRIQKLRHGHTVGGHDSPEYHAYIGAKMRCNNPNDNAYPTYGGRGIKFLFQSFEEFLACVGVKPKKGYRSLDRIDNNGHYEKGNLRWATRKQQNWNKNPYRRRVEQFTDQELLTEVRRRNLKP